MFIILNWLGTYTCFFTLRERQNDKSVHSTYLVFCKKILMIIIEEYFEGFLLWKTFCFKSRFKSKSKNLYFEYLKNGLWCVILM